MRDYAIANGTVRVQRMQDEQVRETGTVAAETAANPAAAAAASLKTDVRSNWESKQAVFL